MYRVTKTYGHDLGLSAVFRQHRAQSHCAQLHGYALGFTLVFEADELDENGWVINFGGLKPVKQWLQHHFDHVLVVAKDDPRLDDITMLSQLDIANVLVVDGTGCEAFAKATYDYVEEWLCDYMFGEQEFGPERDAPRRVRLVSVECREHGANSATYERSV